MLRKRPASSRLRTQRSFAGRIRFLERCRPGHGVQKGTGAGERVGRTERRRPVVVFLNSMVFARTGGSFASSQGRRSIYIPWLLLRKFLRNRHLSPAASSVVRIFTLHLSASAPGLWAAGIGSSPGGIRKTTTQLPPLSGQSISGSTGLTLRRSMAWVIRRRSSPARSSEFQKALRFHQMLHGMGKGRKHRAQP